MSVDFLWPKRASFCRSPLVPYNTSPSPVPPKSQRWALGVRHFAPGAGPEKTLSVGSAKTRKQRLERLGVFLVGFLDPPSIFIDV